MPSPGFRWPIVEPPAAALLGRQPYYEWLIVGVICIGAFIGQLDASIVQLALPALKQAFDTSVDDVRWVAIAYLLAYASFLPVFGRLCEMHGRKLLYLVGFAIFAIASLLCGFAPSLGWLVALRALQGVGGAMLGANSLAILMKSVDGSRRPHAIGLFTTAQAVGVSAGPAVGGLLLDALGWQWVFWVAVPFSLAAALFGCFIVPVTHDLGRDKRFDWPGALLLMPSLVLAVLILNQASVWPVTSPQMVLCAAATVILLTLFIRRERVAERPLVDLGLFSHRAVATGMIGVVLSYALLFGMFFLMSFALIHGFHNSARLAGLKLAVIPVAIGLFAPVGIALDKTMGSRAVGIAGMALSTAALVALSGIALHPIGSLVAGLSSFAVFGVGLGLFMAPNNHATLDAAPSDHASQTAAMLNLLRVLGSCIGVSVTSSMMSWRMHEVDELFGGRPLIDAAESSLVMLVIFGLVAAGASLARPAKPA